MDYMTRLMYKYFIKKVLFTSENEFTAIYSLNREYTIFDDVKKSLNVEVVISTMKTGIVNDKITEVDLKKYIPEEEALKLIQDYNGDDEAFINYVNKCFSVHSL